MNVVVSVYTLRMSDMHHLRTSSIIHHPSSVIHHPSSIIRRPISVIGKPSTTWRTSTQTYLSLRQDDVIANIERRTHQVLKIPESHGEPMQVLRYELTQKYDPHHDYFNPVLYQTQPHMLEMVQDGTLMDDD